MTEKKAIIHLDDLARFAVAFKSSFERLHPDQVSIDTNNFEDTLVSIAQGYNDAVQEGSDINLQEHLAEVGASEMIVNGFKVYKKIQNDFKFNGLYCHDLASANLKDIYDECEGIVNELGVSEELKLLAKHRLEVLATALFITYGPSNVSYITIRKALFNDDKKGRNMLTYMENMKENHSLDRRKKRNVDTCINYFHNQYYNPNSSEYNSLWCNVLRACIDNRTLKMFIVNYDELIDSIALGSSGTLRL